MESVCKTEQFTLLWVLFVLIVLGNSAVLAALLLDSKGRKSRMNFFIMQLALAVYATDICVQTFYETNKITSEMQLAILMQLKNNKREKKRMEADVNETEEGCNVITVAPSSPADYSL
ncbi:hypothetical protein B566_EDAN001762 [Ephemera danica]|nr:hypothetical protein B566_EDAN001762 [Ephemera danica]